MNPSSQSESRSEVIRFHEVTISASAGSVECGNWELAAGEAWFVAGGAVSGKTSLLRAIAGLERPLSGRIERFGDDWAGLSEGESLKRRRRIGAVLCRDAGLFHRLTVLDNVRLPLRYHGGRDNREIDDRSRRLLASLEIEKYSQMPGIRVGAAVARRALLARSLALSPEVLLLDEPFVGLDERERRRLMHFLTRLHGGLEVNDGRAMTLIITGNAPSDWRDFGPLKWALLREGRFTLAGEWEQLVASAPELFHDPDLEAGTD